MAQLWSETGDTLTGVKLKERIEWVDVSLEPSNDYRWVSVSVGVPISCLGEQTGLSYFLTRFKLDRSRSKACTRHHKPSAYLFESCSGPEWKLIISAGASYNNITLSSLVLADGGSNQSCCETNFVAIKCSENEDVFPTLHWTAVFLLPSYFWWIYCEVLHWHCSA